MRKVSKIISILLVMSLLLGVCAVSFAQTPDPNEPVGSTADPVAATDDAGGPDDTAQVPPEQTENPIATEDGTASVDTTASPEEGESAEPAFMGIIRTVITVLILVFSAILIIVVLMQKTKSTGLGGAFGGDTQSFTVRGKAASKEAKLQKITVVAAIIIGVLSIVLTILD